MGRKFLSVHILLEEQAVTRTLRARLKVVPKLPATDTVCRELKHAELARARQGMRRSSPTGCGLPNTSDVPQLSQQFRLLFDDAKPPPRMHLCGNASKTSQQ